jgi:ABC-type multidrug transport system fused ATPase/permease subunit
VIARRLSTGQNADRILEFKDDQIVEQGVHLELTALDGLYAQLKPGANLRSN